MPILRLVALGHAIMRDRGMGPAAGIVGNRDVLEFAGFTAKGFERLGRVNLGELSAWRVQREPVQEARDGGAVANMRRPGAANSTAFLRAFISAIGSAATAQSPPASLTRPSSFSGAVAART